MINIQLFWLMLSQLSRDIMKMYTLRYDFVFYLNLHFLQIVDKKNSLEYVIQFSQRPNLFNMR